MPRPTIKLKECKVFGFLPRIVGLILKFSQTSLTNSKFLSKNLFTPTHLHRKLEWSSMMAAAKMVR